MASNTEQLIFEILAKDAQASAAFDKFRNKVDDTSKSVDKNSAALDKNAKSADANKKSQVSALGALVGTGLAFLPITAGAAAAGIGVTAFAALAVPSAKKVVTALTGTGGLAASWVTLDNRQRNAALGVQALGVDYSDLAKRMEPQVFQVFNQGLTLAHSLLGPTGQLARTSGQGISDFLATFSASSGLQHFIAYVSSIARPAIGLLGSDVTHLAHTVFAALQAFGGTGLLELRALTGVFTALDDSVSFLSQHAPGLTAAGVAIGGIALALSKLGLLSGALKITGISAIAGQLTGFIGATKGATLAEKGLLASTTALDAVTPWGWAILGAAALGGLVFWLSRTKTSADATVTSLEAQNKAVGFNTAGYVAAAAAIKKTSDQQGQATIQLRNARSGMVTGTASINALTGATDTYNQAQQNLSAGARQQNSFLDILQARYHVTRDQAARLAEISGVLVDKQGKIIGGFANGVVKAEAFGDANRNAQTPVKQLTADMQDFANTTLTATQRQKGLTDALSLFFDPAVKADQSMITLAGDAQAAATAIAAAGGKTQGLTGVQGAARGAFDTYIQQVRQTAQDVSAATGKTSDYSRIIDANIPRLERMAGANRALRAEIQDLINTERGLTPENVRISVGATGSWNVVQGPGGGQIHAPGAALGMFVSSGRAGVDDQVIRAQRGELVVPTRIVSSGAVDHLRGQIPGFAGGGVVGSYHGTVPGTGAFLRTEDSATLLAIERSVAMATLAGIHAARSQHFASGGLGRSSLRQIENWWTGAGGPGGIIAHIAAAITGAESGFNPGIVQQGQPYATTGWGLWQITPGNSEPQDGIDRQLLNGPANARAAVAKFNGAGGFSPWTTFMDGAYLQFMDGGGTLAPGINHVYNGTGRPEPLVPAGNTYNITVNVAPGASLAEAGRQTVQAIEAFEKRSGKGWRK